MIDPTAAPFTSAGAPGTATAGLRPRPQTHSSPGRKESSASLHNTMSSAPKHLPHLFSSFRFADGLVAANRIAMAPLTRSRAGPSRVPNDLMVEYYRLRASAGLIISDATTISEQANGWTNSPGIYTPEMVEGWKKVVQAVKAEGGIIGCQLWHMGRVSHSSFQPNNQLPVAPSPIKVEGKQIRGPDCGMYDFETPRPLELDELPGIIQDYKRAAQNALEAGFDFVEVHGANGYLLDQFLQSCSNHRTDAYGGPVENRFRLMREVVQAVQEVYPPTRVGIRLSPNGVHNSMGSEDNVETFLYAAEELAKMNIGYIHMIDTVHFGYHEKCRLVTLEDFRRVFKGVLIGNGGYTKELAEEKIAAGLADFIAFGKPFISNPDLVERFRNDWPLSPWNRDTFYTFETEGYLDYPLYQPGEAAEGSTIA